MFWQEGTWPFYIAHLYQWHTTVTPHKASAARPALTISERRCCRTKECLVCNSGDENDWMSFVTMHVGRILCSLLDLLYVAVKTNRLQADTCMALVSEFYHSASPLRLPRWFRCSHMQTSNHNPGKCPTLPRSIGPLQSKADRAARSGSMTKPGSHASGLSAHCLD